MVRTCHVSLNTHLYSVPSFAKTTNHLMHCNTKQTKKYPHCIYSWTTPSMSAFLFAFLPSQSTGILVYSSGPHVSSGSSWTLLSVSVSLCTACLLTGGKQIPQLKNVHSFTDSSLLLCLSSKTLCFVMLVHDANFGEKKKKTVYFWTIEFFTSSGHLDELRRCCYHSPSLVIPSAASTSTWLDYLLCVFYFLFI